MKKWMIFLSLCAYSCSTKTLPEDPVSFHKGYTFWKHTMEKSDFPYSLDDVMAGMKAASSKKNLPITEEAILAALSEFEKNQTAKNLTDAEEMLQSLSKDCIELIPERLYYQLLHTTQTESPTPPDDIATFSYTVSLLEKGAFQTIFSTGETAIRIDIENTIPGFSMAAMGMHIGERRVIYMHPDLTQGAYPEFLNKLIKMEVMRQ